LFGRSVPHISRELEERGLGMAPLYPGIRIPAEVVRRDIIARELELRMKEYQATYGRSARRAEKRRLSTTFERLQTKFTADTIDFGALDEESQMLILAFMTRSEDFFSDIIELNPFLQNMFELPGNAVASRQPSDLSAYSLEAHRTSLRAAYRDAMSLESGGCSIDKILLLDRYLTPTSFSLLAS
jgi:hypothetical protein